MPNVFISPQDRQRWIDEQFKAMLEWAKLEVCQGQKVLQDFEASLDTILQRVDEVLEERKRNPEKGADKPHGKPRPNAPGSKFRPR